MLDTSAGVLDPLTQVLLHLRLDGLEYRRSRLHAPWGIALPAQPTARFYFIASGECWLRAGQAEWVLLRQGDAVLLPRGAAHVIASARDVPAVETATLVQMPISDSIRLVDLGHDGASNTMHTIFSADMRFNLDARHPLLTMMPEVIRAGELARRDAIVPALLDAMESEVTRQRVGACGILARMADVVAATTIRAWAECVRIETTGWIAALRCPVIGHALAIIHADPAREWTIPALARLSGTSRAAFSAAFKKVLGEAPARYMARLRMLQASEWIANTHMRVSVAAERLGYESEASFSRAYKRIMGMPPSAARTRHHPKKAPKANLGTTEGSATSVQV